MGGNKKGVGWRLRRVAWRQKGLGGDKGGLGEDNGGLGGNKNGLGGDKGGLGGDKNGLGEDSSTWVWWGSQCRGSLGTVVKWLGRERNSGIAVIHSAPVAYVRIPKSTTGPG